MKRFTCCLIFFLLCSVAFTQRLYFIYIEAEAQQPFFVKIGEKIHSSTASGYLFLSKLKDSSYTFSVGFPKDKWPLQQFSVAIKSKDHGFLLKNFGDKGWGLFDLQTLSIQMTDEAAKEKVNNTGKQQVSAFTAILSKAANDPSLLERPIAIAKAEEKLLIVQPAVVKEVVKSSGEQPASNTIVNPVLTKTDDSSVLIAKKETVIPKDTASGSDQQKAINETATGIAAEVIKKPDSSALSNQEIKKEVVAVAKADSANKKNEEVKPQQEEVYKRSVVTKKSESSTTEGFGLIFIDENLNGQKDTIRILIPNQRVTASKSNNQPVEQKKFLDITSDDKDFSKTKTKAAKSCESVATENDFLKLRKKMAAQKTDDEMINESKKTFKAKCFTTEQVKNLGNLFLSEAAKFQFYEVAYPFSSDRDNFVLLEMEFKDNYFIHRFKKLVN